MNKQFKLYLQFVFIFLDLFVLSVSFILPKLFSSFIIFSNTDYSFTLLYFWIYSNLLWISLSLICGNYFENVITHFELFTKSSAHVYMLWVMFVLFYLYLYEETKISGLFLLEFIFFFALGLLINRFIYIGVRNYFKNKDYLVNRVLILGYNVTTLKLASYFEEDSINTNLIGFAEDEYKIKELTRYPIVSGIREVLRVAKDLDIQEIYSTITPEQNKFIYTLMEDAEKECIRFKVVPNLSQFFSKPFMVDFIRDLPILSLRSEPLEDVGNKIKKRLLDILISSFVIIFILSWLIPLLGLLIIIQSKGPVLFIQKRTGKNNQEFNCFKFRSMQKNDNADLLQATKSDSRITWIGKFMRKTNLDEFPQFINVFKGEMSIVGPRPHMIKHTDDYSKIVDQYMIRHFLKPGITGWAQIKGYRGEIKDPNQIKMRVTNDLWYLENWNIWLDLRIIFLTVYSMFKGDKNAY